MLKKRISYFLKIIIAFFIVLIVSIAGVLIVRNKKKELASIPPPVKPIFSVIATKVKIGNLYEEQKYLGVVKPQLTAFVSPLITARIVDVKVTQGDLVKKGQCLIILDSQLYRTKVLSYKAELDAAKTALYTYEGIYSRDLKLFKNKALSKEALDKSKMARDLAKSRVISLENRLKDARIQLSFTKIFAPFNAIVTQKFMDVSDVAVAGKPILKLDALDKGYKVVVKIPQQIFPLLQIGQEVEILSPYKKSFIKAKISRLFPQNSQGSSLATCEIYLKKSPFGLPSGSTVEVIFKLKKSYGFIVPTRSILHQATSSNLVFVVTKNNTIHRVPVKILLQTPFKCCIVPVHKGELSVGDNVVVAGEDILLRLHEGEFIHVARMF
jgi:RND family efflux transporter MFP subunit